ncbi:hypothetical protein [Phaffia rhodozyma]|uniref:Uncharacterized protein n=1 Tax=Phaffia rhodozyma TaxID=264483 RepID=A0A0F7SJE9_PHARH|nr:hypothetical protein [Phaffia rhodozyma]
MSLHMEEPLVFSMNKGEMHGYREGRTRKFVSFLLLSSTSVKKVVGWKGEHPDLGQTCSLRHPLNSFDDAFEMLFPLRWKISRFLLRTNIEAEKGFFGMVARWMLLFLRRNKQGKKDED